MNTENHTSHALDEAVKMARSLSVEPIIPGRLRRRLGLVKRSAAVASALEDVSAVNGIDNTIAYWALQAAVKLA